jgi:transposase
MERYALSDRQWEQIEDLLPQNGKRGGQWKEHRGIIDGILWILNTGAPWRDLPKRFGKWKTVYERFRLWSRNGFWDRLLERLQARRNAEGELDWELFYIDGSLVRAHKAAAGAAKKRGPPEEPGDHALGRSRGGFGTKLHLVCEGGGLPIVIEISPGQDHESVHLEAVMEAISVRSPRGAPRKRPERLAGDKAYSADRIRQWLRHRRIEPVIAHRENEAGREGPFDREAYRRRNLIERCIGWIKEKRRIATRYEKLAIHYLGMLKLAMIMQYLKEA